MSKISFTKEIVANGVTQFSFEEMTKRLEQADKERQQIRESSVELLLLGNQIKQKYGYKKP